MLSKITDLTDLVNEKTTNQTVFVKVRTGLGFSENESSLSPQDKLNMELTEKADKLNKALHECKT